MTKSTTMESCTKTLTLPDVIALGAKHGDYWCINELTKMHTPLIRKINWRFAKVAQSFDQDDLFNTAVTSILELLKSWNPGHNASFYSYLYAWLPMKIRREMDYQDSIVKRPNLVGSKARKQYAETGQSDMPYALPLFLEDLNDGGELSERFFNDLVEDALSCVSPESAVFANEVLALVNEWPEQERRAFTLVLQGYSLKEAADQLGSNVNTLRTNYYARLRELKASLV